MDHVRKRNGSLEKFNQEKITQAILKAAEACGGSDEVLSKSISDEVVRILPSKQKNDIPEVEEIQDLIEYVLIERGHAQTAKTFILYREKRTKAREKNALIGATIDMFSDYLDDKDWRIKENSNTQKSLNGLNNYVREKFTEYYWLNEIYPNDVKKAHEQGDMYIHDLGNLSNYCAGWDLRQILQDGFGGAPSKVESKPPKHFRSALGQIVNSTFITQGELAGAQAWSSFDTYLAPFIYYDGLNYEEVKQAMQEFIFNLNVSTRTGYQPAFSNLTFDVKCPLTLENDNVVYGGEIKDKKYSDFQKEIDMINIAFCDIMLEGDKNGKVFTFPIPTLNIGKSFDWDNPIFRKWMEITCKYGIPYFANYVNSDLSEEDAISMCCRLRIGTKELRNRGGGLFGSNPLTGSIGVCTINLPRLGYLSNHLSEFKERIKVSMNLACNSLEIKRKEVERLTEKGLYPYSAHYLRNIKERTGEYWYNHFSTIGLVGMNEAIRNLFNDQENIGTKRGIAFAEDILVFMRDILSEFQEETEHVYNLEATPAEGCSYKLASSDKAAYPDIITAGSEEAPYYTNSTMLPVGYTDDIFEAVEKQSKIQSLYTGGVVHHLYLGEKIGDIDVSKKILKGIFEKYELPYLSFTPTFSICPIHHYLSGEHFECPYCESETEVFSRVTGYLRPISSYNTGKRQEYSDRKMYTLA